MKKFLVINGPNLNLLGKREPEIYGTLSLNQIEEKTKKMLLALTAKVETEWFQSNLEGEIINKIQEISADKITALIINPGAYAHTSVAIYDALKVLKIPIIEVHLTNTAKREEFRQKRITANAAQIIIEGAGPYAYYLAIYSQLLEQGCDDDTDDRVQEGPEDRN